jgi:hypothetical protein
MPLKIEAYKCEACDCIELKKEDIERHEKHCSNIDNNKSCPTCKHFEYVYSEHRASYPFCHSHFGNLDRGGNRTHCALWEAD